MCLSGAEKVFIRRGEGVYQARGRCISGEEKVYISSRDGVYQVRSRC